MGAGEMFKIRRPTPRDMPQLRSLLTTFFESGELGRELSFGELEIQDYLDWFLPRALVDDFCLFRVLVFHPQSSVRVYAPKIVGCFYVRLENCTTDVPRNFASLKLRISNTISDIQVWPNRQAAEVHRRLMRVLERKAAFLPDSERSGRCAHLVFLAVQEKYRGVGLGTMMTTFAADLARQHSIPKLFYVGTTKETGFMCQSGFHKKIDGAAREGEELCVCEAW